MELEEKEIYTNPYWLDNDELLKQVDYEYNQWLEAVITKRTEREDDLKKYVPTTKDDKVNIHTIFTTIQTLMSVYYSDKMNVEFSPRRKEYIPKAEQINRLAQFDYDEMWLSKIDYEWMWNTLFFWVWIKVIDWWNKKTQTPISKVINPLCWIPDPKWWFDITSHRWAWFETETTKESLKKNKSFYNVDLINCADASRQDEIYTSYKTWRWLPPEYVDNTPNKKYPIYNHYTIINGDKYLVTTANFNTLIIRIIKLDFNDDENIVFPIALKYFSPLKWDNFWISVPDLLKDKQIAESRLFNLTLIWATRNALWDDKVYNPKKIKNIKDLQTPTVWWKYIAANINEWETLWSVIMTVPKENPTSLPFDLQQAIRFQTSMSTWMDANSLWITSQGWETTATEAQIAQKNANLRFILWNAIQKWWEESFWKIWYKTYVYNMPKKSKKAIRITQWFETRFYEISKDDFITDEEVDIKIISTSEKESLRNKEKMDFYSIAPQFLWDNTTPTVSKLYTKRKMYRLMWLPEEEVMRLVPLTLDERLAYLDVELINNNQEAQTPRKWQDHLTFIEILNSANNNKYKMEAISERTQLYIDEWQQALDNMMNTAWWDNTANNIAQSNASSRMSANMIKEASNEVPSLNQVKS